MVARQGSRLTDGQGVAVHIAVDAGAQILLAAAAADGLFHGILHVALPEQAHLAAMSVAPVVILGFHVGQICYEPVLAAVGQIALPERLLYPRRVGRQLGHGLAVVAAEPGVHDLVEILRIANPAALVDVVAQSRGDELVFVGIVALHQELGHGVAHGRVFNMLAQRPPAVIVELFELLLRALEEGHVLLHPLPCLGVGNGLHDVLVFHLVEVVHVVLVVLGLEEGGGAVGVGRRCGDVADGEGRIVAQLAGVLQRAKPVGIGVNGGEVALHTGAEHHALDALYRCVENALAGLLAVDEDFYHAVGDAQVALEVVGAAGLVLQHVAVAGTALTAHHAVLGELQSRAAGAVLVEKLYLQQAAVVLRGFHVEGHRQVFRSRYLALHAGIVERVVVGQTEPLAFERHGGALRTVDVPRLQVGQLADVELRAVGMAERLGLHRHGDVAHPHVFLVHGVGNPQVAVGRCAVAFQDAARVLRSAALVVAAVAQGRHLAVHEVERGVLQTVFRQ